MADNLEEIQKSIKKYIIIGTLLIVFTVITVLLSYWELPTHGMNIGLGMIVATFKAGLVALIFMHLNHERTVIHKILAFTFVFAVVLFLLFHFAHSDPLVFKDFDATSSLTH